MGLFGFYSVLLDNTGRHSIIIPGFPTSGEKLRVAWNDGAQAISEGADGKEPSSSQRKGAFSQQCVSVVVGQPWILSVEL